jgi:signal transduction histidine kinase
MPSTILLIAPAESAEPVAAALRRELDCTVQFAANRRAGLASLRRGEFSLVLLDEALTGVDPQSDDLLYQNAGTAPVLEINFAISSVPRVVRQVRAALSRRVQDQAKAHAAAAAALQSELNASLTGLLLGSQLALREAPPDQAPKLRHLVQLANDLRNRLRA